MLDSVGAVGPPTLGEACRGRGPGLFSELLEGAPDAEVAGQEGVRVAQRPHRDVRSRPGPDTRQREQPPARLLAIGAGVQHELAIGQGASQTQQRAAASTWHREPRGVYGGQDVGGWEDMGHRTERTVERPTVAGHQAACERRGAGERDLLTEHSADGELVAVHVAGHPPTGRRTHQRAQHAIGAQHVCHRVRIRVEIEQRTAALHRGGEVAQILQQETRLDVTIDWAQLDGARAVRQMQAAPVGTIEDLLDAAHEAQLMDPDQLEGVEMLGTIYDIMW